MNKSRVNGTLTGNTMITIPANLNEKEKENIQNDVAQNLYEDARKQPDSGDVKRKNNGGYQKNAAGRRRTFSPKRKPQMAHNYGVNQGPNHMNGAYNSYNNLNSSARFGNMPKISTGTMTIPQLMVCPPNYNPNISPKADVNYQYNMEFLHEVGLQMANGSHRQGLTTSIYRNSNNGPMSEQHQISPTGSSTSIGSNQYHKINYNSYSNFPQNNNQNGHYQQRNNNYRNYQKQWNWNNHNNYRQNNKNVNNRYFSNSNHEMFPLENDSSRVREDVHSDKLVYVNTNIRSNGNISNGRMQTQNFQSNIMPAAERSIEIPSKELKMRRSSISSSPEHHSIDPDSDSDSSAASLNNMNASKISSGSEKSKKSNHSNQSVPSGSDIGDLPVKQFECYPQYPSVEVEQTVPYSYDPNNVDASNTFGAPQVNLHVQVQWVANNFPRICQTNDVQIFVNDVLLESSCPNVENNCVQQAQYHTHKRGSDKQYRGKNKNKSNAHNGNIVETNNNYLSTRTGNPQPKHPFNHVVRFNPIPVGGSPVHALYPQDRFLLKAHLMFLNEPPRNLCNDSKFDRISQDVWSKFVACQQTEDMYRKKILLWKDLTTTIRKTYSRLNLFMVGSTITGFGTDTSDIDICIVDKLFSSLDPRSDSIIVLTKIKECIQQNQKYQNFHLIQARVPIIRFTQVDHNVEIDLNFNNIVGIRNTHLLHAYGQMDWRLRPLVLLVKHWAHYHNINDARNATISSYSLVLMVIHFLQCGVKPAVLPCLQEKYPVKFHPSRDVTLIDMNEEFDPYKSGNEQSLGELFVEFLGYYSNFNYLEHAISVRTASVLPIEECRHALSYKNDVHQWKVLCIEEPFDLSNTARSVYDIEIFERIKLTFLTSWQLLQESNSLDSVFNTPLFIPINTSPRNNLHNTPPFPFQEMMHSSPESLRAPIHHH